MCSHSLNGPVDSGLMMGKEECTSPSGYYELLIPVNKKLDCSATKMKDTNCKDLDVSLRRLCCLWLITYAIRDGEVLRARVTHQCGRNLAPRVFWPFWSVGVALLTKQSEDSVYEIDAAWVRCRVGFSAGAPHFPFLQKPTFPYSSLFTHYNSQTVSHHSVHKKTGLHYHRDEIHQLQRSWRKSNSSWNVRKLLSEFLNTQIIKQVKPGSQMPPMHLRHARRCCLGWEQKWPADLVVPVFTAGMHACEVDSSSTSQACRR